MIDEELANMSAVFDAAYSGTGRPGVPPERLLKALLLQAIYSVRSETQLVERIDTDLLFRWFLDMDPAEDAFDQTAFTHNRPRLEKHGIGAAFFDGVVKRAMACGLTSDEHFSVDGTLGLIPSPQNAEALDQLIHASIHLVSSIFPIGEAAANCQACEHVDATFSGRKEGRRGDKASVGNASSYPAYQGGWSSMLTVCKTYIPRLRDYRPVGRGRSIATIATVVRNSTHKRVHIKRILLRWRYGIDGPRCRQAESTA
ncbi:MAG TPA: transposase [Tepidisphaeraceae bacterium]